MKARDVMPVVAEIEQILENSPAPEGTTVTMGGLPYIRVWVAQHFRSDQIVLVPLSLLVCCFILFLSFRWAPGVVFPIMAVIVSAVLILGAMALAGESINIINQVVPILIIVIGISDSIHLVSRFLEESRSAADSMEASRRTLRFMAVACLLTSVTTAVGFASLVVSRTDILVRFGITAAVGVMIAYLVTIHLLPPLLSFTRPHKRKERATRREGRLEESLESLMRFILRRPKTVLLVSAAVMAGAIGVAALVTVDSRLMGIFRPGDAPWETTHLIQDELEGVMPLEVSFRSEAHGRFDDPEVLNRMQDFEQWVETQDGVLGVTGYSDYLHQAAVAYHDDEERRTQPFRSISEVASLASFLEGGNPSPIEPYVTLDRRRARINVMVADIGAQRMRVLIGAIERELEQRFGDLDDLDVILTGNAHVASIGISSIVDDLFKSLLTAFAIIFVLMTLLFRSVRMGLMSVPPNVVPLITTMAYMTISGIELNTTTVVAFAISLGLAVDHTIHMLARFREELARGKPLEEAIVGSARGTGRAIVVTSLTLFIGMLVLLLSSFVPVSQFATLIAVTALSCLLGNLIVLPALLKVVPVTRVDSLSESP
jgi:predicted RND superfamily exporter protein